MIYTDEGILVSCSNEGRITNVYFNKTEINTEDVIQKLLPELFREDYITKALNFFMKVKEDSASFGWEFFLNPNIINEPFYFSGAIVDNDILIFGSKSKVDFNKFITGMMLLNNEQINKIRELEKERKELSVSNEMLDVKHFNELSRLNNELVSIQRELTKKNLELAELDKIKNQFIGMAAHDLRNPLGSIFIYTEFLEEEKESFTDEQLEFLNSIKTQSSFMLNLLNELLDVVSIESGKVKLNLESADIIKCISHNLHLNKAIADKKKIKIEFETKINSCFFNFDKVKMEQVLSNLITNAIKYSNSSTTITVSLSKIENDLLIAVKDEGQGIASNELDKLFKPFQRTSAKTTAGEKSTGLGLFIVKRIVEAHNGKIWAESKVGVGSTFKFVLPINN